MNWNRTEFETNPNQTKIIFQPIWVKFLNPNEL